MTKTREIETEKPVKVDLTYLCPNDPNRAKIIEANGVVLPEDGPTHLGGYLTDIKNVEKKKQTFAADGRHIEFPVVHQTALWTCSTCGAEVKLDPYRV